MVILNVGGEYKYGSLSVILGLTKVWRMTT